MKYINADKLRAEIERQERSIENATGDFAEGRRFEQMHAKFFLDTLEQEPQGLDEAAEELVVKLVPTLGQKYEDGRYVSGIRDYFSREELIGLVKAGASWMAGQGVSFQTTLQFSTMKMLFGEVDGFKDGDEVIVQIRKKEFIKKVKNIRNNS